MSEGHCASDLLMSSEGGGPIRAQRSTAQIPCCSFVAGGRVRAAAASLFLVAAAGSLFLFGPALLGSDASSEKRSVLWRFTAAKPPAPPPLPSPPLPMPPSPPPPPTPSAPRPMPPPPRPPAPAQPLPSPLPPPDVECYVRRYDDLLAGFCGGAIRGCDWARLQGHWDTAGRAEGRQFACLAKPPSPPTPPAPPHPPAPPQPYPPPPRTAAGERINARWTNGRCLPQLVAPAAQYAHRALRPCPALPSAA